MILYIEGHSIKKPTMAVYTKYSEPQNQDST